MRLQEYNSTMIALIASRAAKAWSEGRFDAVYDLYINVQFDVQTRGEGSSFRTAAFTAEVIARLDDDQTKHFRAWLMQQLCK